jgi:hypothetical protein
MSDTEPVQVEPVTPHQVKAARLLLGWSMSRLGMRSGTSVHTARVFERSGQVAKLYCRTERVDAVAAVRATLEAAGVEFTNGGGPGVRLRQGGT